MLRGEWFSEIQPYLCGRRVWFMDETGVNLKLAREYARATGGTRAFGSVPKNYGMGVTLLGAMTAGGQMAALEVRGATDEAVMLVFIREVLRRVVRFGDCVVLDNLTAHKTRAVQAEFAALGVEVFYPAVFSRLESNREMLVEIENLFENDGSKRLRCIVGSRQRGTGNNHGRRYGKLVKTLRLCVAVI